MLAEILDDEHMTLSHINIWSITKVSSRQRTVIFFLPKYVLKAVFFSSNTIQANISIQYRTIEAETTFANQLRILGNRWFLELNSTKFWCQVNTMKAKTKTISCSSQCNVPVCFFSTVTFSTEELPSFRTVICPQLSPTNTYCETLSNLQIRQELSNIKNKLVWNASTPVN